MTNETKALVEVEAAVDACNAVAVSNPIREALIRDLKPIADKIGEYQHYAKMTVGNQAEADDATQLCIDIAHDVRAVKQHEVVSKIKAGLHRLHRQWTALEGMFVDPLEESRTTLKRKVIAWQENERRKAEDEQRKLQAEADARAKAERDRLEAKAAKLKTPEKREALLEQAASVVAPTVIVEAPKTGMRMAKVWKVKAIDAKAFLTAAAANESLHGFIEVRQNALERSKAANPMMHVPGIEFEQVLR